MGLSARKRACRLLGLARSSAYYQNAPSAVGLAIDGRSPVYLRSDNGPEVVARVLRQWVEKAGIQACYIEPRAPWENGHVGSFHENELFCIYTIYENGNNNSNDAGFILKSAGSGYQWEHVIANVSNNNQVHFIKQEQGRVAVWGFIRVPYAAILFTAPEKSDGLHDLFLMYEYEGGLVTQKLDSIAADVQGAGIGGLMKIDGKNFQIYYSEENQILTFGSVKHY